MGERGKLELVLGGKGQSGALLEYRKKLQSPKPDERLEGIRRIRELRKIEPLIEVVRDENAEVRKAARSALVEMLVEIGGKEDQLDAYLKAREKLESLEPRERIEAIRTFEELGIIEPLIEKFIDKDEDRSVRITALGALVRIIEVVEEPDNVLEAIRKLMSTSVRANLDAIKLFQELRLIEPLIEALRNPSAFVRLKCVHALVEMKDPRSLNSLIERFKEDPDSRIRMAALDAIKLFQDPKIISALIERLPNDPDSDIRIAIATMLGERGNDLRIYDALANRVLNDPSEAVRTEAEKARTFVYERLEKGLIERISKEPDDKTRRWIVAILEKHGNDLLVYDVLVDRTEKDPDGAVRSASEKALVSVAERCSRLFIERLKGEGKDISANTIYETILRLRIREAVGPLIEMLHHDNPQLRSMAAWALGKIGDPKAIEPLKNITETIAETNSEEKVKLAAERALEAFQKS